MAKFRLWQSIKMLTWKLFLLACTILESHSTYLVIQWSLVWEISQLYICSEASILRTCLCDLYSPLISRWLPTIKLEIPWQSHTKQSLYNLIKFTNSVFFSPIESPLTYAIMGSIGVPRLTFIKEYYVSEMLVISY